MATLSGRQPLSPKSPPPTREALNNVVYQNLRPISLSTGFLFAILAIADALILQPEVASITAQVATGTAVLLLALFFILGSWQDARRWAHPIAAGIALLCHINALLHLYLLGDPEQTTYVIFIIVSLGLFVVSVRWYLGLLTIVWLSWTAVALTLPPSPNWVHFIYTLGIGTLLSAIALGLRRHNARQLIQLQTEEANQQAQLAARAEQLEILQATSHALNSTLDTDELVRRILRNLGKLVQSDRTSILMRQEDELVMLYPHGFPAAVRPEEIRIPLDGDEDSLFQQISVTKRPLAFGDVGQNNDFRQVDALPQTRSWLAVPLIIDDHVSGLLSLARTHVNPYTQAEIELATTFAESAAIALKNAQVYDQSTRFNQQLEYEVRQRTKAIQEAYHILERLDQTKSDFISITSHELRTPLTLLRGYSQMLLRDEIIQANDKHQRLVKGIDTGGMRLEEIINTMLDMAKIDSRALKLYPEPLQIPPLIQLVVDRLERTMTERQLTIVVEEMDGLPAIEGDPDALQKAFQHLIINAIKYTPDGGHIRINGRSLTAHGLNLPSPGIELIIKDTGIGIDPAVLEIIFSKFYQTGRIDQHSTGRTKFKGGGPGLGLAIARGIVEAHNGRLWAASPGHNEETLPGSSFHIALPLSQTQA